MTASPAQRLLVVDDQPANLQVLGSILGPLGYDIVAATDGESALKRLVLRPPDLVLLDLLMPGIDGFEVCRRIRDIPAFFETPIIFLSAADEKDLIVRALECGGVDYITKPFSPAELIRRVQTHLHLKAARDRLARLAEDKEELLGILAHDLKNHVSGMHMTAQVLADCLAPTDGRLAQMAANLITASGQTLTFLREFLANAARDHGPAVQLSSVDLPSAIRAASRAYAEPARLKNQSLECHLPDPNLRVRADENALRQIIDNLLSNAVKFSPPGAVIQLLASSTPGHAEFSVQDQGPGFSPEDRPRMFRRYTRLSARPTGGEPSTGLGLSIVQRLVLAMNGTVDCLPASPAGSRFVVRLPREPLSR